MSKTDVTFYRKSFFNYYSTVCEFVRLNTNTVTIHTNTNTNIITTIYYYYDVCKSNSFKSFSDHNLGYWRQKIFLAPKRNIFLHKYAFVVRGLLAVQGIVDQWFSGILQQILNEFGNREMHCHHYPQKNPWASSSASREVWRTVLSLVFVTDLKLGFAIFCPLFKEMQGSLSHSSCPLVSEFPENAHP